MFIIYEFDTWSRDLNSDFTLKDSLLGGVKLAKSSDPDKYVYSGYGIGFDSHSEFSLSNSFMSKNIITFGFYMSSSVHIDNKRKDVLILGIGPSQQLDNTMLAVEAQYSIYFSRSKRLMFKIAILLGFIDIIYKS